MRHALPWLMAFRLKKCFFFFFSQPSTAVLFPAPDAGTPAMASSGRRCRALLSTVPCSSTTSAKEKGLLKRLVEDDSLKEKVHGQLLS